MDIGSSLRLPKQLSDCPVSGVSRHSTIVSGGGRFGSLWRYPHSDPFAQFRYAHRGRECDLAVLRNEPSRATERAQSLLIFCPAVVPPTPGRFSGSAA